MYLEPILNCSYTDMYLFYTIYSFKMQTQPVYLYNNHNWDMLYEVFLIDYIEGKMWLLQVQTCSVFVFYVLLLLIVVFLAVP